MDYPKYLTFAPGELEQQLRKLGKLPDDAPVNAPTNPQGRSKLLKALTVTVSYPDGTTGPCAYERLGPAYHRFEYRYHDGAMLHRQYVLKEMANTTEAIDSLAKENAAKAFQEAIRTEQKDRFKRVSEPTDGSRKKDPTKYQMKANMAKAQAGKYAVCVRVGRKLCPTSLLYDTIEEANERWKSLNRADFVVACCCRLDRCWDIPKYNPLPKETKDEKEEVKDDA